MKFNNDYENFMPSETRPRLMRTYKALCSNCNQNITVVTNAEREGICWKCSKHIKSVNLIKKWYKTERKRKNDIQKKYICLVLLHKTNLGIQSGLYENVTKFI